MDSPYDEAVRKVSVRRRSTAGPEQVGTKIKSARGSVGTSWGGTGLHVSHGDKRRSKQHYARMK